MAGQAQNQYLKNLPNYANMVGSRTENISQQLRGQLPQDVINQIGQQAAERGISGGSPGSPNANAAYLRALGLNSLQMQQQGNQNLSTAIGDTPVAPLFSPGSMIVPNYFGQQELTNARLGQVQGQNRGYGGVSYTGAPTSGRVSQGSPTSFWDQQAGLNSWLQPQWNQANQAINAEQTRAAQFAQNPSAPYGPSHPQNTDILGPYNQGGSSGGAYGDYNPFGEEDSWMANNTSTGNDSGFWEDYL